MTHVIVIFFLFWSNFPSQCLLFLAFCSAEMRIRQEVQMFDPLPSHLAYPDILGEFLRCFIVHSQSFDSTFVHMHGKCPLAGKKCIHCQIFCILSFFFVYFDFLSFTTEEYVAHSDPASASALTTLQASPASTAITNSADVYQTWYPPMRNALSLLSKLYGVVELPVFEHFARRSIDLCVAALKKGSEGVKRSRPGLHGDLFLVRHLLMLREQLTPFELRLTSTEKVLDFTSTSEALQFLLSNTRSILRFDQSNGLLTLARTGLPRMQDVTVDAKKELDLVLKSACMSLKSSAVKSLLGGMEAFLVKVITCSFFFA